MQDVMEVNSNQIILHPFQLSQGLPDSLYLHMYLWLSEFWLN